MVTPQHVLGLESNYSHTLKTNRMTRPAHSHISRPSRALSRNTHVIMLEEAQHLELTKHPLGGDQCLEDVRHLLERHSFTIARVGDSPADKEAHVSWLATRNRAQTKLLTARHAAIMAHVNGSTYQQLVFFSHRLTSFYPVGMQISRKVGNEI